MVGGALAAGSANALNCYIDRDIDAVMRRTGHRPLARHDVSPRAALIFGLVLGVDLGRAIWVGHELAGRRADRRRDRVLRRRLHDAAQAAHRRRTSSGAARPAACPSSSAGPPSPAAWPGPRWRCSRVVFFWTPPHFWALAIRYRDDYARAGIPMLPVVATPAAGRPRHRRLRLADRGRVAGRLAAGRRLGLRRARRRRRRRCCWSRAHQLYAPGQGRARTPKPMRLFHLSNSYLAFLFVAVALDTFVRH